MKSKLEQYQGKCQVNIFSVKGINIKDVKIRDLWDREKVVIKMKYTGLNICEQGENWTKLVQKFQSIMIKD